MRDRYRDRVGRLHESRRLTRRLQDWILTGVSLGFFAGTIVSLPILALAGWPTGLGAAAVLVPCLALGGLAGRRFGRFMNRDCD